MSRSRKRFPIEGWSCKESEKKDKQIVHRKFRRLARRGKYHYKMREISEVWDFAKDGKQWVKGMYKEVAFRK